MKYCARVASAAVMLAGAALGAALAQGVAEPASAYTTVSFDTADGGHIYGNVYGNGAHAVVLAHGAVFDKESWHELATRLAGEGYTALAIDFRGYGQSRAGTNRGALHEDVLGAVRYLRSSGARRVAVLGASMGGGASGTAAAQAAPGEIDELILLAAVAADSPDRMQGRKLFIVAQGDGLRRTVEAQFAAAPEPKKLVVLEGSAHAQHLFRTDQGAALTATILAWLAEAP